MPIPVTVQPESIATVGQFGGSCAASGGRPGLLYLVGEVGDGFGTVVPAPGDTVALQVHAADPPVDAVEGDLVGLAGQHSRPRVSQAYARCPLNGTARRVE